MVSNLDKVLTFKVLTETGQLQPSRLSPELSSCDNGEIQRCFQSDLISALGGAKR
jgi:hypothetical protein